MNRIFKNLKLLLFVGMFVAVISIFQSCGSELDEILETKECAEINEYLDCPEDALTSKRGLEIVNKAFQRIQDYLVVKDDTCYLTILSADEVNMSNNVFSIIKQSVTNANIQYQMYLYFKDNDMGNVIKNPFGIRFPLSTTRGRIEYTSVSSNSSTTTIYLDHIEVTTAINALRASNGAFTGFAGIIRGKYGAASTIASILISAYGYLTDSRLSYIQDEYAKSGSTKGVTLIRIDTWSTQTNMTFSSYVGSINQ